MIDRSDVRSRRNRGARGGMQVSPESTTTLSRRAATWRARWDPQFWFPMAVIGTLAAGLRLPGLSRAPVGFNQDEMVLGYDAWSLWTTGRDHHGAALPVYFQTFNDYVPPVANYLAAPFVGILGLREFTTRLPFALLGIAAVVLTGLLGRRWFGRLAGVLTALLAAVDIWHVASSRRALPASLVPFFTVLALLCFARFASLLVAPPSGDSRRRRAAVVWLVVSALAFDLLTATYPTMKVEAPLLIGACWLASAPLLLRRRQLAVGWLAVYVIGICPLLVAQVAQWNRVQARFDGLSILGRPGWLRVFSMQYAEHFDPRRLFFSGYLTPIVQRPPGIGELFWLEGPLCLVGLVALVRRRRPDGEGLSPSVLAVVWLLTFPIASSLTNADVPHESRALNVLPLPELLAGYGAAVTWRWTAGWPGAARPVRPVAALASLALLVVFVAAYLGMLFAPSPLATRTPPAQIPYNVGLRPALEAARRVATPCDTIWVDYFNQAYIYYLFLVRYPPARYQQAAIRTARQGYWEVVLSFDNVHFGPPGSQDTPMPAACAGRPVRAIFVTRAPAVGPGWTELVAIKTAAGIPVWRALVRPRP